MAGKVILMGEHSVLYGYNSVLIPLDINISINIKKSKKRFRTNDVNLNSLVYSVLDKINKGYNIQINLRNPIPKEKGLGSSAAFSIKLIEAILAFHNKNLSDEDKFILAKKYEDKIHNPSSGADIKVQILNHPIIYSKTKVEKFNLSLGLNLVIIDSLEKGSTKKAIQVVNNNKEKNRIIKKLGMYTKLFIYSCFLKNFNLIKIAVNSSQNLLKLLGLSTKNIDDIVNICNSHNALATKMSGSGLGGIVISFVYDQNLKDVLNALSKSKYEVVKVVKI